MTDHFREAVNTVSKLSDNEQNRIADIMLGLAGKAAFGERRRYWIAGEKPDPEKVRTTVRGLREFRKDISLGGLSIRELIEEGRH